MKLLNTAIGRLLALTVTAAILTSCAAHGQRPSMAGLSPELRELPHWKVFRNNSSHSAALFKRFLFGRVFVHEHPTASGIARAEFVRDDGRLFLCFWDDKRSRYAVAWAQLEIETHSTGAARAARYKGGVSRSLLFYEPQTGSLRLEALASDKDPRKREWEKIHSGWIQEHWPRVLADACPDFVSLSGVGINEKQTSRNLEELRRQDPDAPIRNFPSSQLIAPGRTGLAASSGRPTTTKAEVEAFLAAQEGNIMRWNGHGWVWVRSRDREEVWRVRSNPTYGERFFDVVRSDDGARITIQFPTRDFVYMVGYPFHFLPTGHRHPAFQITDKLLADPYPRALPSMGEAYADKRFVFHPEGKFSVVDEAGNLVEGPHFDGTWRWTRQALEMTVRDDPAGFQLIHWRSLAHQLGMKPTVWTPSTPDRY